MEDNNKTYGFVINIYDSPESIETLWPQTLEFIAEHPEHLHSNNAIKWLTDSNNRPLHNEKANGYSTCHFWSNFEIADMTFWRSKAYKDYFDHLDRAGGFFYERWGDAPVHSIALALFEDRNKIHWCVSSLPPFLPRPQALMRTGSAILGTSIFRTSTARLVRNARAARRVGLRMERGWTRRIAERIGSNLRIWVNERLGMVGVVHFVSYRKGGGGMGLQK